MTRSTSSNNHHHHQHQLDQQQQQNIISQENLMSVIQSVKSMHSKQSDVVDRLEYLKRLRNNFFLFFSLFFFLLI